VPRQFLVDNSLYQEMPHLRGLSAKLVTLPRAAGAAGVAALPFTMPSYGFPLPDDPAARKAVHKRRLNEAIKLESDLLASTGGTDPLLKGMLKTDQANVQQFS
jgi:hypothetical protein